MTLESAADAHHPRFATVLVIGAGQAGLSAAHHLMQAGFHWSDGQGDPDDRWTFAVLDANPAPGGAWQHRWESLRMRTVNGIFNLPGMPVPPVDPDEPSRTAVPGYFDAYERSEGMRVQRPVTVQQVQRADRDPNGRLLVHTDHGLWSVRAVINASGTWNNPLVPHLPGQERFRGSVLHARDYRSADDYRGGRVGIVGGGITAVQLLDEVSAVATTRWYTRHAPVFHDGDFVPEVSGVDVERRVTADVEAGRPSRSIVSYTGLLWSDSARAAAARGALERRSMFTAFTPYGVVEADGSTTSLDTVIWATGFRPDLAHLDALELRNELGGIPVRGTSVLADPRIQLIGFGPSQSTVGGNRSGRAAVAQIRRLLDAHTATPQGHGIAGH